MAFLSYPQRVFVCRYGRSASPSFGRIKSEWFCFSVALGTMQLPIELQNLVGPIYD